MIGDLAPHEAFPIGGTNSVRGYDEGSVGSGRSCVVASGEISIPLVRLFFLLKEMLSLTATDIYTNTLLRDKWSYKSNVHCTHWLHDVQAGPVEGAVFADYGSDLGSGSTVPGNVVLQQIPEY